MSAKAEVVGFINFTAASHWGTLNVWPLSTNFILQLLKGLLILPVLVTLHMVDWSGFPVIFLSVEEGIQSFWTQDE